MRVGFVGLGAMGSHMARNLHRAGMLAGVWNRTAETRVAPARDVIQDAFDGRADLRVGARVGPRHLVDHRLPPRVFRRRRRPCHRGLRHALYQGWDMHPGHLVTRYAASYDFYRGQLRPSCDRLAQYTARAASGVLDEPATVQAGSTLDNGVQWSG